MLDEDKNGASEEQSMEHPEYIDAAQGPEVPEGQYLKESTGVRYENHGCKFYFGREDHESRLSSCVWRRR